LNLPQLAAGGSAGLFGAAGLLAQARTQAEPNRQVETFGQSAQQRPSLKLQRFLGPETRQQQADRLASQVAGIVPRA
jgi:hypothetical protein